MMTQTLKERLIQALIEAHELTQEQIDEAIKLQQTEGMNLDQALIKKKFITEKDLLMLLVRELNIPFINLKQYKMDPSMKDLIPERVARQYGIVPFSLLDDMLTIVVSDPLNVFVADDIKSLTGKEIDVVMSTHMDIMTVIDQYYRAGSESTINEISQDIQEENFEIISEQNEEDDLDSSVDESEKAPIIRMVNLIIKEALVQRSSDIHMEPTAEGMRVRYRIDGALRDILDIPKENQNAVLVRIKIMSRLDITMNQIPQDGRFKLKLAKKEVDFRVSLLPTTFGQKIVMRVLDKSNLSVGLDGLGVSAKALKQLNQAIKKPFGMVLVTGPTGSGKSTTLYSILNELNTVERNIITVEDPVEYLVDGLTQIQTHSEIGLTFAEGLRAMLRQSPDVVMVGEIRDGETADIAIKASLTGQLVFSTLHTNDAAGALTRLVDMGVEPFLVASSLVLVSAQRLCRKICPHCKEVVTLPDEVKAEIFKINSQEVEFYQGKGCDRCRQTGCLGRTSIVEILEVNDDVRNMLIEGESSDAIKEYARKNNGLVTLWEDAMHKCMAGEITYDEVIRVSGGH